MVEVGCLPPQTQSQNSLTALIDLTIERQSLIAGANPRAQASCHHAEDAAMPIALTGSQLDIVTRHAEPLPAADRDKNFSIVSPACCKASRSATAVSRAPVRKLRASYSARPICTAPPGCRSMSASCSGAHHRPPEAAPLSASTRLVARPRFQPLPAVTKLGLYS